MLLLLSSLAFATEGMWLPEQVPALQDTLQQQGLQIPAETLANPEGNPLGAIVHVSDYCSGAFVSADGLVVTNHHCAWEFLQFNSTAEHNFLRDGFVASSRGRELWGGPGARLYIVEKNEDVTSQIVRGIKATMGDGERASALDRAKAKLVARCEKQADRRCEVTEEYGGRSYRLITSQVIRDLRLVYVPPQSIGSFGGDRDNFEWPRHDGDFAILRAYVSPNGKASAHNPENQPYHPSHYLKVQRSGISPGDFAMIAGFPGGTQRYVPSAQLAFWAGTVYPAILRYDQQVEAILAEEAAADPRAMAALGGAQEEYANERKYYQGVLDNVAASSVLEQRRTSENLLRNWVESDPGRKARYGAAFAELDQKFGEHQAFFLQDQVAERQLGASDLLSTARTLVHWVRQRAEKDLDREPGFRDRDREDVVSELESLNQKLWLPADRRILRIALEESQKLPPEQRIAPLDALVKEGMDAALSRLYSSPRLEDGAYRLSILDWKPESLAASPDPWLQLALALEPVWAEAHNRNLAFDGAMSRLLPRWMDAQLVFRPGTTYPDANNTLRLSFGTVQGYHPRDAVTYLPQTTVSGMVAKADSGEYPPPPSAFLEYARGSISSPWIDPKLQDVPLCFLTDLDSTGGNSGSATLNSRGELVGLLFDGNYESIAADWLFDQETSRSVHVDIRYLFYVLDATPGSRWVLQELAGR